MSAVIVARRPVRAPRPRWLLHALPLSAFLCCTMASAAKLPERPAEAATSTMNFVDADVDAVARAMAMVMGRPIFVDPRVKGKITLVTEQPVTNTQAYAMFLASLRGLGFSAVAVDGTTRIVPEAEAKVQAGAPVRRGAGRDDLVVTQIFKLTYENANNLVPVLRPLITPNNTINVNAGNNSLVVTDYADNLARIGALIAGLDTPRATDVEVMPLQHVLATDLAATILKLVEGSSGGTAASGTTAATPAAASPGGSPGVSVVADPKLNALLVRAPNPARLAEIRALVGQLVRTGGVGIGGGNIHVIYLKYAEAARLATVLRAAAANDAGRPSGQGSASSGGGGGTSASTAGSLPSSSTSSGSSSNSGAESAQATTPVSSAAQPSLGGYIQADPATNSLIITAPQAVFDELKEVVAALDTRRAQLYVESLVVEVDATRATDIGIQWKQIFGVSQSTLSTMTIGDIAEALQSMAGTNILSTANLVTLDNEEAKIVVGQNVPFITGSYTTTGSNSASPFQTVERKDVGITLRIRPQIGPNGNIRMKILQESSSVSASTTPGTTNSGPTTNKRSIESTVLVNDGKIIVLGGLIEDSYDSEAGQVPVLAEIPVLGGLFRYFTRTRKKTNLIVFLRPHVMADETATDAVSLDRYDYIRARQLEHPKDVRKVLEVEDMPALPALPASNPDR